MKELTRKTCLCLLFNLRRFRAGQTVTILLCALHGIAQAAVEATPQRIEETRALIFKDDKVNRTTKLYPPLARVVPPYTTSLLASLGFAVFGHQGREFAEIGFGILLKLGFAIVAAKGDQDPVMDEGLGSVNGLA
jgi:hypothetical protein